MITVGIRELKNRLTQYLRLTKKGEQVVVTDRGVPIAIVHDLQHLHVGASPQEHLASAVLDGFVRLPKPGSQLDLTVPPLRHRGKPASQLLLEDRR